MFSRPVMAQEEQNQRSCNSGGGGGGGNRSSKRLKQKKVPQRGLGVAQLEKIRLEEQQKKDAAAIFSPSHSLVSPSSSSCLASVQCASNFRHNNPSPSSNHLPPPPPSPTDLPSLDSVFRAVSSVPNTDVPRPNPVPLSKPSNGGGEEMAIPSWSQGNLPRFCYGDYSLEGDRQGLDHGLAFRPNINLQFESNPMWPPPNLMQRTQQYLHQPSNSSMVNVSSVTSSFYPPMEPPSNQSFYGNNYAPLWPEEEKMVGMKRPYPFSLDNQPGPSFHCKFPTTYVPPFTGIREPASCINNGETVFRTILREGGPSSSSSMPELNPKKVTKENGDLNGDFLTLAPPTRALPHPSPKYKHPSAYPTPPEFGSLPYQGNAEVPIHQPGPVGSIQPRPFYSFFPSPKARIGRGTGTLSSCSGESGEKLDLNLKL